MYFQIKPPYQILLLVWSIVAGIISESYIEDKIEHSKLAGRNRFLYVQEFSLLVLSAFLSGLIYIVWNEKVGGSFINSSVIYILVLVNLNIIIAIIMVRSRPKWLTEIRIPMVLFYAVVVFVTLFTQGCI